MANIWFTADFHLGHANIIRYCGRPFADVAVMDTEIIDRLNAAVAERDLLYCLGDFCRAGKEALGYRKRIRCKNVFFVEGNHDIGNLAREYDIELIAPNRRNRSKTQDGRKLRRYRRRWRVERLFAWMHNFRRLVTRWEYHIDNFLGFVHLGCLQLLLRYL